MLVPLATSGCGISLENFWHALHVYHDRPHLINRKIGGITTLFHYKIIYKSSSQLTEVINYTSLTYESQKIEKEHKGDGGCFTKNSLQTLISDLLLPYDKNIQISEVPSEDLSQRNGGVYITVRVLLPSNPRLSKAVELAVFNYDEKYAYFVAGCTSDKYMLIAPPFPYQFMMQADVLKLIVDVEDADTASGEWLADKLFPKVLKWCEEGKLEKPIVQSLGLIAVEKYFVVYNQLKDKYGKKMVKIWPENTDPLKFVYEDIAIATYLICLWNTTEDDIKKPSFVDLGCGNGLLVYILNEEGYPGLGIDVRKRKIWDLYPKTTNLQVRTITPSDSNLFPEADWIIGNHSDELTPWVPVIAARSSPTTNFFLLPCCCYNFDGTKYKRINTAMSQYAEYMQYVESVCNSCGFFTQVDKLRIPSTKRTCLVGRSPKTLPLEEINANICSLLGTSSDKQEQWIENYQARESSERVRNCTQLDRGFVVDVVRKLVRTLLTLSTGDNKLLSKAHGEMWNAGTCVEIITLVKSLGADELRRLKSECGGLQTLLKNHRYIFDVAKGRVQLRPPYLRAETEKYVGKPCWFLRNHPDGCLYTDDRCGYSHVL